MAKERLMRDLKIDDEILLVRAPQKHERQHERKHKGD